jgi:type VI protein secretion system component Hcp
MRCTLRFSVLALVVSGAVLGAGPWVEGASIYLSIPSIAGENPTPGYPGAILVNPLDVTPDSFSIQKTIDKATPKILAAVAGGTPLHTVSALFYNAPPSGPPDAILPFVNVFASSQVIGPGLTETDGFAATTPDSMYLEVSGITDAFSTPGYSGLMKIDSLDMSGNTFTVGRKTDSATPQIQSAVILGTHHTASLLFYNTTPSGPPDVELDFQDVIASSFTPNGSSGDMLQELDGFNFVSISQPSPEPGSFVLALLGAAALVVQCFRRRRAMRVESLAVRS